MTRTRIFVGTGVVLAIATGAVAVAVAGQLVVSPPKSFAECLLVNAREARATADGFRAGALRRLKAERYAESLRHKADKDSK